MNKLIFFLSCVLTILSFGNTPAFAAEDKERYLNLHSRMFSGLTDKVSANSFAIQVRNTAGNGVCAFGGTNNKAIRSSLEEFEVIIKDLYDLPNFSVTYADSAAACRAGTANFLRISNSAGNSDFDRDIKEMSEKVSIPVLPLVIGRPTDPLGSVKRIEFNGSAFHYIFVSNMIDHETTQNPEFVARKRSQLVAEELFHFATWALDVPVELKNWEEERHKVTSIVHQPMGKLQELSGGPSKVVPDGLCMSDFLTMHAIKEHAQHAHTSETLSEFVNANFEALLQTAQRLHSEYDNFSIVSTCNFLD